MSRELSRRAFLKLIAVTGAAASGCTQPPTRELIPYVVPDENVIPGVPSFFASVCRECPASCGVVARIREGRAIKLEGNPRDPISAGALCARGQAALQGLYHPDRLATPELRGANGALAPAAWEGALHTFAERLSAAAAAGEHRVAFLGPPMGPTVERIVERWLGVWRSNRRLRYEALDDDAARRAGERCFGRIDLPVYRLDGADVLLAFAADFLATWRSPVELARQYAAFRAPRAGGGGITMGRAVYVGPHFGLTAARCDEWLDVRPGDEAPVALGMLHHLAQRRLVKADVDAEALGAFASGYPPAAVAQRTGVPAATIQRVAEWFGNAGAAVALAGTADSATHVAVAILNSVTGNVGKTVRYLDGPAAAGCSGAAEITALLEAMRAGAVDVLVIADANPVFTLPGFTDALSHVPFVVWCGGVPDETAARAHLTLPRHHALETWSDAAPRPGVALLGQPVMQPVVRSLPLGDILLASVHAAGAAALPWENTHAAVEATWRERHAQRRAGGSHRPAPRGATHAAGHPAAINRRADARRRAARLPLRRTGRRQAVAARDSGSGVADRVG
jgi:anaerobic selenocysteine-containing dehydrogenase